MVQVPELNYLSTPYRRDKIWSTTMLLTRGACRRLQECGAGWVFAELQVASASKLLWSEGRGVAVDRGVGFRKSPPI